MARKVDFNFTIDYDKLTNIFIYKDSENIKAEFCKITFAENNPTDNVDIQSMPLNDVINVCKSLGYDGIIDLFCIGGGRDIDDTLDAIKTIQMNFSNYVIIMGYYITFYDAPKEEDDNTEDVIELGPMDCIDDDPYFAPYPYIGWMRYIYTGFYSTKRYDLISTRACRYRIKQEYDKINKLLTILDKSEDKEMAEEFQNYKKMLGDLMATV